MKLNRVHKKILADIVADCVRHNVTVLFSNTMRVKTKEEGESAASNGYFDSEDKVLAVACGKPIKDWFWVMLHEYNHMIQWINGRYFTEHGNKMDDLFWSWLFDGKKTTNKQLREATHYQRACELDCEKRTVDMLNKYPEIGIDPIEYTKKANAYLYFYTIIRRCRKWYVKAPYEIEEIAKIMPETFLDNYNRVPSKYKKLVEKYCFGG